MESVACYRTKPLEENRARGFAKCLAANPSFTQVEVIPSRSPGKFSVVWHPASESRQADLIQHQVDARTQRAMEEGSDYLVCRDLDGGRQFFHVYNPKSGETHGTTPTHCTCGDWEHRASKLGVPCKHQISVFKLGLGQRVSF
jgi:hypothetical protein